MIEAKDYWSMIRQMMDHENELVNHRIKWLLTSQALLFGAPERIPVDNGPEFVFKEVDLWAYANKVVLDFSRPGKPTDNAYIESFNGKLRQECLDQHWFKSIDEARRKIEAWRLDYNRRRPHSSLKDVPPEEFLQEWRRPEPLRLAAIGGFS